MSKPRIAIIVPSYGQFEYVRTTVISALKHTPESKIVLVDDFSKDWDRQKWSKWPLPDMQIHRFSKNGGLTRSWNWGLSYARREGFEFACCANSDLLFTPNWFPGIEWALNNGVHLAGPVTNAPGHQPLQRVSRFAKGFNVTDDEVYLAAVAAQLGLTQRKNFVEMRVNGFCMVARTETWWSGAFDSQNVFNPRFKLSKNEDELQGRWSNLDRVSAAVPSSFVFHYRGVTRKNATRGKQGEGWFRKKRS